MPCRTPPSPLLPHPESTRSPQKQLMMMPLSQPCQGLPPPQHCYRVIVCEGGKHNWIPSFGCTRRGKFHPPQEVLPCLAVRKPAPVAASQRVRWMAEVRGSHLKPGQAFCLFLASAIVCAPVEEQMPGAFADESTGCTTGLQNCTLPEALCFQFAWLLYNFTDPLGMVGRGTHSLSSPYNSLFSGFGGGLKLCLWETGHVSCNEVTKSCCFQLSQVPKCWCGAAPWHWGSQHTHWQLQHSLHCLAAIPLGSIL